jgi:hypothetical protein
VGILFFLKQANIGISLQLFFQIIWIIGYDQGKSNKNIYDLGVVIDGPTNEVKCYQSLLATS